MLLTFAAVYSPSLFQASGVYLLFPPLVRTYPNVPYPRRTTLPTIHLAHVLVKLVWVTRGASLGTQQHGRCQPREVTVGLIYVRNAWRTEPSMLKDM